MCDSEDCGKNSRPVTTVTHEVRYGDWCFEQAILRRLGAAGVELAARQTAAQEALAAQLGRLGFELLDAYVSATTALACAREEAILAHCAGRREAGEDR